MNTKKAAIGRWAEIYKHFGLLALPGKTISRGMSSVWSYREIPL